MNWTELCMEITISGDRGVAEGFPLENYHMDMVLVNWAELYMESPIGGECGVAEGGFLGKLSDGPQLRDVEGFLVKS